MTFTAMAKELQMLGLSGISNISIRHDHGMQEMSFVFSDPEIHVGVPVRISVMFNSDSLVLLWELKPRADELNSDANVQLRPGDALKDEVLRLLVKVNIAAQIFHLHREFVEYGVADLLNPRLFQDFNRHNQDTVNDISDYVSQILGANPQKV